MRALLLGVFMLGCAAPASPSVAISPKHEQPSFKPLFHVIARGYPQTLKHPTWMRLCPIDGAVFVCGASRLPWLRGTEMEINPALQKGLSFNQTWIMAAYGSWPGNAWLRVGGLNFQHEYYRYRDGAWHLELTVESQQHSALVPRPGGPLFINRESVEVYTITFAAPFGGSAPEGLEFHGSLPSDGDIATVHQDIFVLERSYERSRIVRLDASMTHLELPEGTFLNGLRQARGALVAFGERDGGAPILQRFEDERWWTMTTTGLSSAVQDYAGDARNDWVIAGDRLHHRRDGEPFSVVDLPLKALQVWSANDDDAWVVGTDGKEGVLLRTIPSTTITKL